MIKKRCKKIGKISGCKVGRKYDIIVRLGVVVESVT